MLFSKLQKNIFKIYLHSVDEKLPTYAPTPPSITSTKKIMAFTGVSFKNTIITIIDYMNLVLFYVFSFENNLFYEEILWQEICVSAPTIKTKIKTKIYNVEKLIHKIYEIVSLNNETVNMQSTLKENTLLNDVCSFYIHVLKPQTISIDPYISHDIYTNSDQILSHLIYICNSCLHENLDLTTCLYSIKSLNFFINKITSFKLYQSTSQFTFLKEAIRNLKKDLRKKRDKNNVTLTYM